MKKRALIRVNEDTAIEIERGLVTIHQADLIDGRTKSIFLTEKEIKKISKEVTND